jgi:predicted ferric reductase
MSQMKRVLVALAVVPLGLWAVTVLPDALANATSFWDWRKVLIVLSGIVAFWWMSAGMLLAARPRWIEQRFGGLDKLFRLHRDIGIGAGVLIFLHWQLEWLPKTLTKAGILTRPARPGGPRPPEDMLLGLAKDIGEWAGYILLALVVIALVKRIPYRWFRLVHKVFGLLFIGGAFHGLMLLPTEFWRQPLGWLTAAAALIGIVPALLSLAGRIGYQHRHPARIEAVEQLPDNVLAVTCRPLTAWPGHAAGQFVFADFGTPLEGAHPFTIASAWDAQTGTLALAIKALGDYTRGLPGTLKVGQEMHLEGPYGGFTFAEATSKQVWVAGGIGITPFLARLQEMASTGGKPDVTTDFFYCMRRGDEHSFPSQLDTLCAAAGVRLHLRYTDVEGPLDSAAVQSCLQPGSSVWFCGPAAWGAALARALVGNGLPPQAFHRELFEFR